MNHIPDKPPLKRTVTVRCPGCLSTEEKFDKRGHPLGLPEVHHKKGCKIEFTTTLYSYDGLTWARNGAKLAQGIDKRLEFLARIGKPASPPEPPDKGVKRAAPLLLPMTVVGEERAAREKPMRRKAGKEREVKIARPVHYHTCLPCSVMHARETRFVCSCDTPMWRRTHEACPARKGER